MSKPDLDITNLPMVVQNMAKYAQSDAIRQAAAITTSGLIFSFVAKAYGVPLNKLVTSNLVTSTDSWSGAQSRFITNLIPLSIALGVSALVFRPRG